MTLIHTGSRRRCTHLSCARQGRAGRVAAALVLLSAATSVAAAQEAGWARFRGPNGAGVNDTAALPAQVGPTRNVVWKTALPPGHSSPVLVKDRVFVSAAENDRLLTLALDRATGRILWRREVERRHALPVDKRNHPAAPTPAADEAHVYVFFQDVGLVAYDHGGTERWRLPLGPFTNAYGMGASPIVVDDLVVLVCDQSHGSFILAVDKMTGAVRWRVERPESKTGHSTPIVYRPSDAAPQLLVPGSFSLVAYSLAGERLWWVNGLAFEMKATPVLHGDIVYIHGTSSSSFEDSYGRNIPSFESLRAEHDVDRDNRFSVAEIPDVLAKRWMSLMDLNRDSYLDPQEWAYYQSARRSQGGLWAFRLGGRGDMTASHVLWHYNRAVPQLPSPLLYRGVLYIVNDGGIMTALNPADGAVLAQRRLQGAVDSYYASPVGGDGKVFMVSESGILTIVNADAQLSEASVNDLDGVAFATPAIDDGRLYVRTRNTLYCFGLAERP
jgi:outer membrane protein assembly factor BamB